MTFRAALLYLGLAIAAQVAFAWYLLHDVRMRAIEQQLTVAKRLTAELGSALTPLLAPDGALELPLSATRRLAMVDAVRDHARSFATIERVMIVTSDRHVVGPVVRRADGDFAWADDSVLPDASRGTSGNPDDPSGGQPLNTVRSRRPMPRAMLAPLLGGMATVNVWLDQRAVEAAVVRLRWRELVKLGVLALVVTLLAGVGFSYTFSLLRRTRRLAEDAQRGKQLAQLGTLASGLAHEIRNPLNAMNINLELLEEDLLAGRAGGDTLEMLRASRSEVLRLEQLVKDFLAFARPRTAVFEEIVPGELVADVVRFSRPEFAKVGVALELKHEDIAPTVRVDTSQLRQALLNVLSNALDASQPGQTVEVTVGPTIQGEAKIAVRDQGEGIAAEDLPHIFEVFWSKKLRTPGSGLGLPIAQRAVEEHGGRVEVDSRSGHGATFTIILPPAAMAPRAAAAVRE